MRIKAYCLYIVCLILLSCNENKNPYANNLGIEPAVIAQIDTPNYTLIKWKDSLIDFGTIKVGDSVHLKYQFTNTGNTPLFIISARPGCGCTVTNFPKDPVMPGKSSFITATLKSGFHTGELNKTITVVTNTKNRTRNILVIRGIIEPANDKAQIINQ
jgi:hypothetical protein